MKNKAGHLFPPTCPNIAIVSGILEGKIYGNLWLNSEEDACLLTTNSPFNFMSGNVSDDFLKKALSLINISPTSLLVHCSEQDFFHKKGLPTKLRQHFSAHPGEIKDLPEKIDNKIVKQYRLSTVNAHLFEHCSWNMRLLEFYQTKEFFLEFGYGSVLLDQQQIIAEVYGTIGSSFFELGAFVDPKYRGIGLVPYIVAHSIKPYCLSNNLAITASCDATNVVSQKTILRLGLNEAYHYSALDVTKAQALIH